MDREMELAREIQQLLQPSNISEIGTFVIMGAQQSAEIVGGDYYDVFPLGESKTGVVIADVAGKGLGGCLVTSMIAVLIRTLSSLHGSPSKLLIALHDSLTGYLQPGVFITMFYGVLDSKTGSLTYASAGHNPVLHYVTRIREVQWHKTTGVPLGLIPTAMLEKSLVDYTIALAEGDLFVQYTDGFHEAVNKHEEEFGFDRMSDLVISLAAEGPSAVISGLQQAVQEWEEPRKASDDQTLLLISRSFDNQTISDTHEDSPSASASASDLVLRIWEQKDKEYHFNIPATFDALDTIGSWIRECPALRCIGRETRDLLEQGLYEVGANIAEHGYGLAPGKKIDFWWIPQSDISSDAGIDTISGDSDMQEQIARGYFLVRDYGIAPKQENWSIPITDNESVRQNGRGLGMRIIRSIFNEIEFCSSRDIGNVTILRFMSSQPQHT